MEAFIINKNQHLSTEEDLLKSIAKSTVDSFKLEGIIISFKEAYQLAVKSAKKHIKKSVV